MKWTEQWNFSSVHFNFKLKNTLTSKGPTRVTCKPISIEFEARSRNRHEKCRTLKHHLIIVSEAEKFFWIYSLKLHSHHVFRWSENYVYMYPLEQPTCNHVHDVMDAHSFQSIWIHDENATWVSIFRKIFQLLKRWLNDVSECDIFQVDFAT